LILSTSSDSNLRLQAIDEETAMRILGLLLICVSLAGCGAVALPFRATADVARVVPGVGDVVAAPLDAAGNAIDPPGE
jgi:uncharacterized protein DUF6726